MRTKNLLIVSVVALILAVAWPGVVEAIRGGGGFGGGGRFAGGGRSFGGGGFARPEFGSSSAPRPSYSASSQQSRAFSYDRPQYSQMNRLSGGLAPSTGAWANRSGFGAGAGGFDRSVGESRPNFSTPSLSYGRPGSGTAGRSAGIGDYRSASAGDARRGEWAGARGGDMRWGGGRPDAGQLGDFLGMTTPIQRPGGLAARPEGLGLTGRPIGPDRLGIGDRPGELARPGGLDRPGGIDRPGETGRPGGLDRPGGVDRPGSVADRYGRQAYVGNRTNNVINVRPTWTNISANQITGINNRWNTAINAPGARRDTPVDARWNRWGDSVRNNWREYSRGYANGWFDRGWWDRHNFAWGGWSYSYAFGNYPYNYWWTAPTWGAMTSWLTWPSSSTVVTQPVYYDYGQGGNVTYQDNNVYINGQQVAGAQDFAESAAALATVAPPENQAAVQKAEWMPLGTFALSTSEKDTWPNRVIQLAVNKRGIISGTLYNTQTDQAMAVQGQVDKTTQRVAFRIGENEDIVMETGLYNLTQNEAPVLVHFGKDKVENYLLVRMEAPKEGAPGPAAK
ncbi:MAG TPA: mu-protocadherin- cell-suface protein [Phycisphaerae bacterium]|nr:mu-protocadherin- cell-suface protein [Phycisphaerae bacterium]HPP21642.1 mu-protocadherin- cell-suface protein [Phycisphaerae bacterium]HPU33880.1 mu-protocadherin- cell-suface protein [Phycisphaerae bacterium]